ncbi:type VII secretion-associated protein [Mycobacterium spongiae]|uniref:Type VII secretion-associated protein n=1 Tax=Mycobacterium spongiae TaxID=886343 RepID=A0A975K1D5_9MYCO|nr:type VII secretion-associated protein [Mycobacterium spongiae]QUR69591.1 type VII secretion-associated protein [Mycobacterium spongiae]
MNAHRVVIEAGPATIRRLCCGTTVAAGAEVAIAALGAIDDAVAVVDDQPVAVDSLWSAVLRSLACDRGQPVVVVHPSWWPASRVGVVSAAARAGTIDVAAISRVRLLVRASSAKTTVVVEITERLVVVTGAEVVAVPRRMRSGPTAHEVAGVITSMSATGQPGTPAQVLIDVASGVAGAPDFAESIADEVRASGIGQQVTIVDDAWLARLARAMHSNVAKPRSAPEPGASTVIGRRYRTRMRPAAAAVLTVVAVAVPCAVAVIWRRAPSAETPATFLVEGRVAVAIPDDWLTQRILAGPGSARVQVTSPSDPEVALHVTQSLVAGETLAGAAERLKRAIDAEPAGVFVDFNPSGSSAGRTAVTYREVRAAHHVRWTVLVDGSVRISIGCQSRPGAQHAVRAVCEQAVRSAHAVG